MKQSPDFLLDNNPPPKGRIQVDFGSETHQNRHGMRQSGNGTSAVGKRSFRGRQAHIDTHGEYENTQLEKS